MNPAENWQTATEPPAPAAPVFAPGPTPVTAIGAPPAFGRKNPFLAALLSAFPGMGHIYNGLYMRGVTFFLIVVSLIGIVNRGPDEFAAVVAFFWLFNVIDAYRQATLINYGYAQDLGLVDLPQHPRASQGGIMAGVLLFLIGLFAIFERYFDVRLDWLFDLWPFALVMAGAWMIWASLRARRQAEGA
jgi:hypothetical protein